MVRFPQMELCGQPAQCQVQPVGTVLLMATVILLHLAITQLPVRTQQTALPGLLAQCLVVLAGKVLLMVTVILLQLH